MSIRMTFLVSLSLATALAGPWDASHAQPAGAAAPAANAGPSPIPRATFISDMETQFRVMDGDKNNIVTVAEIEASQRAAAAARNANRVRALFAELDSDKSGQISPAEFARIPVPGAKPDARPLVSRFDSNKDNAISLIEYRGGTLVNFDRIDTDKDGIASQAEMRAAGIGR